jgi:hypothetical protein
VTGLHCIASRSAVFNRTDPGCAMIGSCVVAERDFDVVFANLIQLRAGGLVIGTDALFSSRLEQLAALSAR